MTATAHELDTLMTIPEACIQDFRRQGFVHLRDVLPRETLTQWRQIIADVAHRANRQTLPLEQRGTYGKAFLQTTNLWEKHPEVRPFVFSKRLADIARQLLGTAGVRLYHDQALFKEAGGGHTPWHADQYYWPLATPQTVTAWIPLVDCPLTMGPLAFSVGSHHVEAGRDLHISDDSERVIGELLEQKRLEFYEQPFDLGDVSFHYGWTFHRAGPNTSDQERTVMTMIYIDRDMTIQEPVNQHQQNDWRRWCPGTEIGGLADSQLNPILV